MMRLSLFAALLGASSLASAQDAPAHALPFASGGHALELALASAGEGDAGPLTVAVERSPAWLSFERLEAPGEGEAEPIARLLFSVVREAPVGVPAEIVLTVRDASGARVGEKTVRVEVSAPGELSVEAPRPNPSRGGAVVPYLTPAAGRVRVSVFDLLGREVAVVVDAEEAAGAHQARVPAGLAAGVYVVRVALGGAARVARLTVVR